MRRHVVAALIASALVAAVAPARAATVSAAHLQAVFDSYGDSGVGWTGADGAYSVPLPDGRVVWMFSDTFLGTVNADHSRPRSAPFINNSFIVQDGDHLTTLYGGTKDAPTSLILPAEKAGFYWMGDGVVEGNVLRAFVDHFVAAPVAFGFQQIGVDVATFSLPDLTLQSITRAPLAFVPGAASAPVSYGQTIVVDGDTTYIYGVEDLHSDKYIHLARSRDGVLGGWEYFTGTGWSTDPLDSARMMDGVSNELSVQRTHHGYLMVTQGSGGKDVLVARAPAPEGPWSPLRSVFRTPEYSGSLITYNAKAHPEFGTDGSLVITYNVNSLDSNGLYADVENYRPRWINVTV